MSADNWTQCPACTATNTWNCCMKRMPRPEGVMAMEKWRRVFRTGLAPQLSTAGLQALATALMMDDPRLLQGAICYPPLLDALRDREVEGACALGFAAWQGDSLSRVGQIEDNFKRVIDTCNAICDANMDEVATSRYFLNHFDDTPRDEMRRELLGEVQLVLKERYDHAA